MEILARIRNEVDSFVNGTVRITDDYSFSQYLLVRSIYNLANKVYPSGPVDSQGNYKYWFDIIGPRISDETKNIDLDTKDIKLFSEMPNDRFRVFLANALLKEWMRATEQGISLNEDIEESTGWGNVLWKKVKGGKTRLDLVNVYVINQKARSVHETPIVERHLLTATQLRRMAGIYDADVIEDVIATCANKYYVDEAGPDDAGVKYYEIFERNGEVSLYEFKEAKGLKPKESDRNEYILAKIATVLRPASAGFSGSSILYCEKIESMSDVYVEYHRGRYSGRWFREGFYEALADIQIRANEIGNEIARSLEISGKQIFTADDTSVYENVMTDLRRGDIVNIRNLQRIDMRLLDINSYIVEWNNLMRMADRITNAMEIVSGGDLPSNMPFRLGAMINENANKTYIFIREKFGLALKQIYENWILPDLIRSFRSKDVVRITGDRDYLDEYRRMVIDNWYAANLLNIGPHGPREAELLKSAKLESMSKNREEFAKLEKGYWDGFLARMEIDITGESMNINYDSETLASLIALETDPVRRTHLLDQVWVKRGIDTIKLPKIDLTRPQLAAGTPPAPSGVSGGTAKRTV